MAKTEQDHKAISQEITALPAGTKEAEAWRRIGLKTETRKRERNGEEIEEEIQVPRIPRHEFRDLWLSIRVYGKDDANRKTAEPPEGVVPTEEFVKQTRHG